MTHQNLRPIDGLLFSDKAPAANGSAPQAAEPDLYVFDLLMDRRFRQRVIELIDDTLSRLPLADREKFAARIAELRAERKRRGAPGSAADRR